MPFTGFSRVSQALGCLRYNTGTKIQTVSETELSFQTDSQFIHWKKTAP